MGIPVAFIGSESQPKLVPLRIPFQTVARSHVAPHLENVADVGDVAKTKKKFLKCPIWGMQVAFVGLRVSTPSPCHSWTLG